MTLYMTKGVYTVAYQDKTPRCLKIKNNKPVKRPKRIGKQRFKCGKTE